MNVQHRPRRMKIASHFGITSPDMAWPLWLNRNVRNEATPVSLGLELMPQEHAGAGNTEIQGQGRQQCRIACIVGAANSLSCSSRVEIFLRFACPCIRKTGAWDREQTAKGKKYKTAAVSASPLDVVDFRITSIP